MPTKALLKKKKKDQAKSDKSSPATLVRTSLRLGDEPRTGVKENGRRRGSREETEGEEEDKKRRQFRTSPGDFDMEGSRCCSLCNAVTEKRRTKTGLAEIFPLLRLSPELTPGPHPNLFPQPQELILPQRWKSPWPGPYLIFFLRQRQLPKSIPPSIENAHPSVLSKPDRTGRFDRSIGSSWSLARAAPAVHTLTKPPPPYTSRYVAVIGAGAAGLVAVRELRREGHWVRL
ncbi:hypothetical protein CRG98_040786 [Punica granatum]|uniref:Uncharacterized protein n=1 Tax=Punica granatum TaxID=22663 RepID=A0A2I0I4R8_PUNGR|nr:hypothetical protein CRG98_040786 [Punica granatum]